MNQRPSGYEPDELPSAPLRDIILSQRQDVLYISDSVFATPFFKIIKKTVRHISSKYVFEKRL